MDLAQPIEQHAAFVPNKFAIRFAGEDLRYAALAGRVRQACGRLAALGIGEGKVVAYLGLNHPEMLVLLFACGRMRAILLPLNWRLAPPEHARVLADAKPQAVIVGAEFTGHAEALRESVVGPSWLS